MIGHWVTSQQPGSAGSSTQELLAEGRSHQLAGRLREAAECFALAVDSAGSSGALANESEALRRLAIVHHLQGEAGAATTYCRRSRDVAIQLNDLVLTADATVVMANMAFEHGRLTEARKLYLEAIALAPGQPDFVAQVEQSLGNLETVEGNCETALRHFNSALATYQASGSMCGEGVVKHSLSRVLLCTGDPIAASEASQHAARLARECGDRHLEGLCLARHAEIDLARERPDAARRQAEGAIMIFQRLGARVDLADASRVLGSAFRQLGKPTLAESRLRSAIEIAHSADARLVEAKSCRDLAALHAAQGRGDHARALLEQALGLFESLGAAHGITDIKLRLADLDQPIRQRRRQQLA